MEPSQPLGHFLAELHTLSTLAPNTHVHKNREGRFIPTGSFYANIAGAQTIANFYKGHSHEKTMEHIAEFANQLIALMEKEAESVKQGGEDGKKISGRVFRKVLLLNQKITQAIKGRSANGGISGLALTHSGSEEGKKLQLTVEKLETKAFETLKILRDCMPGNDSFTDDFLMSIRSYHLEPPFPLFCPEESYTDEEWEEALLCSSQLNKEMVGLFQYYGRYSFGLLYNQTRHLLSQPFSKEEQGSWNWWDLIGAYENGNLHLGALPILTVAGQNDLKMLEALGIKAVLSMVDAFENRSEGFLTSPIKPEQISLKGIKHLQIPTPDCETICFELLSRGVEFIHWNLKNGRSVLVHCKAGMVRSALTVICYLMKYQKLPGEEALALVKAKRRQAGFSQERSEWKTLKDFEAFLGSN